MPTTVQFSDTTMLKVTVLAATAAQSAAYVMGGVRAGAVARMSSPSMATFYDFSATSIAGEAAPMSAYKGKPVLILNVASL